MIRKYRFGEPFPTEAVVADVALTCAYTYADASAKVAFLQVTKADANAQTDGATGWFPPAPKPVKQAWQFTVTMDDADIVYGLGEQVRGINKRGWLYISDNADDPNHQETKTGLYGSHNFVMLSKPGRKGSFGLFIDDPGTVRFDIGYTDRTKMVITSASENFDLYVFTGADDEASPLAIVREFRSVIGRSYIAPKWGFGYGQSRWGYNTESDVREIVQRYRKAGIPLDAMYLDIEYMEGYKDFTVNMESFPDLTRFANELKEDGIRLVPIIDAGIKVVEGDAMCEEGMQKGYFCTKPDGTYFQGAVWPGMSYFTDYLNPEARRWFGSQYKFLLDQGIEGFWNDMNEPSVFYTDDTVREAVKSIIDMGVQEHYGQDAQFMLMGKVSAVNEQHQYFKQMFHHVNGKAICHDDVHNLYGYNMTRAAGEAFEEMEPNKRILMFSRASYVGMHRYGGIWTGDNISWWSHLELVVKQMANLNMVGLLYSGSDTGGFGRNTTEDLMDRWLAFSLFTPLFRSHATRGTRHQELDIFTDTQTMANIVGLRYTLLPYLYSEFVKAACSDDMYFKPLSFVYEGDAVAANCEDQLMVGESIMIAPVIKQNMTGRPVYLPEEMRMLRFRTGKDYDSEILSAGWHYVDCALNEVLVFVRKGHMLPVAAETADCVAHLDETKLMVFAFGDAEYDLYQDDGFTKTYDDPAHMKHITVRDGGVSCEGLCAEVK